MQLQGGKLLITMDYRILPPDGIFEASVSLPPSKSIGTRAAVMAALAGGSAPSEVCADTATISRILQAPLVGTIDVGPAGTAMRFLCAVAAAREGSDCVLTGSERMLHRPIGPLVDALRTLGADIEYIGEEGFPPLKIRGRRLAGGSVDIDASVSSQFISALMMVAPLMQSSLTVNLRGIVGSLPYIHMTAAMMRRRGIAVETEPLSIVVPNTPYTVAVVAGDDEPDWSGASFWYEIAALTAGWVTLKGLRGDSIQGDCSQTELFERLGVVTEFTDEGAELSGSPDLYSHLDADLSGMPDLVPALAVTAALVGVRFRFTGVGALHHKECDRMEALCRELAKIGVDLEVEDYGTTLSWDGSRRPITELPVFDTYSDHRMAMCLAPIAVFLPGIVVRDVEVVDKSYPSFWDELRAAGFTLLDPSEPIPVLDV